MAAEVVMHVAVVIAEAEQAEQDLTDQQRPPHQRTDKINRVHDETSVKSQIFRSLIRTREMRIS